MMTGVVAAPVVATLAAPAGAATAQEARLVGEAEILLAPKGASETEAFLHYERIVRAMGDEIVPGTPHVLGLRGLDPSGRLATTVARREMADTFVVLKKSGGGAVSVDTFRGSTYPGVPRSRAAPDANRDGVPDVGMIKEGRFKVVPNGMRKSGWSYHVLTRGGSDRLLGVRDTNHDGRFSDAERSRSNESRHTLGEILFHPGARSGRVSSIGCLNVRDWTGFMASLGGRHVTFDFTLVNAVGPE